MEDEQKKVLVNFRFSRQLKQELWMQAERENRSLTNLVETILFRYLENQSKDAMNGNERVF